MKCKCGKEAEVQQMNIFNEEEGLCRDCFNSLGEPPQEPEKDRGLFDSFWLGGMAK